MTILRKYDVAEFIAFSPKGDTGTEFGFLNFDEILWVLEPEDETTKPYKARFFKELEEEYNREFSKVEISYMDGHWTFVKDRD